MRIASIVGARPEFIQIAVLSEALRRAGHDEVLIHTGQHYDPGMSGQFFSELSIPKPDVELNAGSATAAADTGEIATRLGTALAELDVDLAIVRGDTNSTAAGALVAKQLLLPLVHVEAGMRSFDRTAPEEINRIVADHLADINIATDPSAVARLQREGITEGVHVAGDVMYDLYLRTSDVAGQALSDGLRTATSAPYDLLTLHRSENVDDRLRLAGMLDGFRDAPLPVLFPIHPRTARRLREFGLTLPGGLKALEPVGYLAMLALEKRARTIFTDSGGVQREAYFAGVPCVTLREWTEWTNTIDAGWNRLASSPDEIAHWLREPPRRLATHPQLFGDGDAARRIVEILESPAVAATVAAYRTARISRGCVRGG